MKKLDKILFSLLILFIGISGVKALTLNRYNYTEDYGYTAYKDQYNWIPFTQYAFYNGTNNYVGYCRNAGRDPGLFNDPYICNSKVGDSDNPMRQAYDAGIVYIVEHGYNGYSGLSFEYEEDYREYVKTNVALRVYEMLWPSINTNKEEALTTTNAWNYYNAHLYYVSEFFEFLKNKNGDRIEIPDDEGDDIIIPNGSNILQEINKKANPSTYVSVTDPNYRTTWTWNWHPPMGCNNNPDEPFCTEEPGLHDAILEMIYNGLKAAYKQMIYGTEYASVEAEKSDPLFLSDKTYERNGRNKTATEAVEVEYTISAKNFLTAERLNLIFECPKCQQENIDYDILVYDKVRLGEPKKKLNEASLETINLLNEIGISTEGRAKAIVVIKFYGNEPLCDLDYTLEIQSRANYSRVNINECYSDSSICNSGNCQNFYVLTPNTSEDSEEKTDRIEETINLSPTCDSCATLAMNCDSGISSDACDIFRNTCCENYLDTCGDGVKWCTFATKYCPPDDSTCKNPTIVGGKYSYTNNEGIYKENKDKTYWERDCRQYSCETPKITGNNLYTYTFKNSAGNEVTRTKVSQAKYYADCKKCGTLVGDAICSTEGNTEMDIKEGLNGTTETCGTPSGENVTNCIINYQDEVGNTYKSTTSATGENKYCSVWCKEDYHITLPGVQKTEPGRYFSLEASIDGTKTCYTSEINRDQYENDFEDARQAVIRAYNTWALYDAAYNATGNTFDFNAFEPTRQDAKVSIYDPNSIDGLVTTNTNCVAGGQLILCTYSGSNIKNDYKDVAGKKRALETAIKNLNNVSSMYNWCTSTWVSEIGYNFNPEVKYNYSEMYMNDITRAGLDTMVSEDNDVSKEVTYYSYNRNSSYSTLYYKQDIVTDAYTKGTDGKESSENPIGSSSLKFTCGVGSTGDVSCGLVTFNLSNALRVKVEMSTEKEFITPTIGSNIYPNGTITVVNRKIPASNIKNSTSTNNKLPVSFKTGEGVYNYSLEINNLGEYYDREDKLGRLWSSGTNPDVVKTVKRKLENSNCSIDSIDPETGKYTCNYAVGPMTCKDSDFDRNICYNDSGKLIDCADYPVECPDPGEGESCAMIEDGSTTTYYDSQGNETDRNTYIEECRRCSNDNPLIEGGKYSFFDDVYNTGLHERKTYNEYIKTCERMNFYCIYDEENHEYHGKNGDVVNETEYLIQCHDCNNPIVDYINDKYTFYDNLTTKEVYKNENNAKFEEVCNPTNKKICVKDGNKYYGKNGELLPDEDTFLEACHPCENPLKNNNKYSFYDDVNNTGVHKNVNEEEKKNICSLPIPDGCYSRNGEYYVDKNKVSKDEYTLACLTCENYLMSFDDKYWFTKDGVGYYGVPNSTYSEVCLGRTNGCEIRDDGYYVNDVEVSKFDYFKTCHDCNNPIEDRVNNTVSFYDNVTTDQVYENLPASLMDTYCNPCPDCPPGGGGDLYHCAILDGPKYYGKYYEYLGSDWNAAKKWWQECISSCPPSGCPTDCVNCVLGKDINYRPITPNDVNPNDRTLGDNWNTKDSITDINTAVELKAFATIQEIQNNGENVYDNDVSRDPGNTGKDFSMKIVLDNKAKTIIRNYNTEQKTKGGYANNSLKCYDYNDGSKVYENIFCYSELIDTLVEEDVDIEFSTERPLSDEDRRNTAGLGYFKVWAGERTIASLHIAGSPGTNSTRTDYGDIGIGPSWK